MSSLLSRAAAPTQKLATLRGPTTARAARRAAVQQPCGNLARHAAGGSGAATFADAGLCRSGSRRALSVTTAAAASGAFDNSGEAASSSGSSGGISSSAFRSPAGFSQLEALITTQFGGAGPGGNWREVEGCWVLYPPDGAAPKALIHFTGGAFVGAAPQLAYRPLLEALADRGALVLVTPYATQFDHLRAVDEVYFKLARCLKQLGPSVSSLPAYGVGHSLGSLVQLLLSSRYLLSRSGNVLMSFNNRPATDSIPLLSPYIAPSIKMLGPLLSQLATSPLRSSVESWLDVLKSASPSNVKQVIPVLEQLTPIYLDISTGVAEFTPAPQEARQIIRDGYNVNRNLLLRFADDTIDETPALASTLQSSAVAPSLELTVKALPGDHVRPLQQDLNQISPDLVRLANQATQTAVSQSESLLGQLGAFAARAGLSPETTNTLSAAVKAGTQMATMIETALASTDADEQIAALADEIGAFCGLPPAAQAQAATVRALPPPPVQPATQ